MVLSSFGLSLELLKDCLLIILEVELHIIWIPDIRNRVLNLLEEKINRFLPIGTNISFKKFFSIFTISNLFGKIAEVQLLSFRLLMLKNNFRKKICK